MFKRVSTREPGHPWSGVWDHLPTEVKARWNKGLPIPSRRLGYWQPDVFCAWTERGWETFGQEALDAIQERCEELGVAVAVHVVDGEILYEDEFQVVLRLADDNPNRDVLHLAEALKEAGERQNWTEYRRIQSEIDETLQKG